MTTVTLVTELSGVIERHFVRRGQGLEFEMEAAWIGANLPKDARRIIDLGCGGGALFSTIGEKRAIGLDLRADGLKHTHCRFPAVPLLCGSVDRIPLADESADAIILQHVIEHLPDPATAIREWFRVLRPGGALLVQTPNAEFIDPSVFDDPTHVHLFNASDLRHAIRTEGFTRVHTRALGLPWFRRHEQIPGGWRLRRWVVGYAQGLSAIPLLSRQGQTLCCSARRPLS